LFKPVQCQEGYARHLTRYTARDYAVFLILTYYGVIACFKNHVSKRSLQISSVIFVILSLASLNLSLGSVVPFFACVLGLLAGWLLALRFYSYTNVNCVGGGGRRAFNP